MVPLPTSLDGAWVEEWAAEDSGRSGRGRGMWEAPVFSKSGSLPLPMVLLGVPLKVPVCDIIMPRGEGLNKLERKGEERRSGEQTRGMEGWYERKKIAREFSSSPRKEKATRWTIRTGVVIVVPG